MAIHVQTCYIPYTVKPALSFQDELSLNAGQKYCRMLQESILQYFRPSQNLPFVVKTFVLSIFEWPFYTGFTVALKIGVCNHYQIVHAFKHMKYHIGLKIRSVCDFFAIFFFFTSTKTNFMGTQKGTLCDGSFEHSKHIYLN